MFLLSQEQLDEVSNRILPTSHSHVSWAAGLPGPVYPGCRTPRSRWHALGRQQSTLGVEGVERLAPAGMT